MSIERIKLTKEELIDKLKEIFNELEITFEAFDIEKKPIQIKIKRENKNSVLRIYSKTNGLKLDTTVGADKELNIEIENKFNGVATTEEKTYSFRGIDANQYEIIKEKISKINETTIKEKENKDPHKDEFLEIKSNITHEKVLISKYKNGTLMLQGIVWNLWEDICEIIDTTVNSSIEDIINRFSLGENNITVDEDYTEEINNVKEIITEEVYDFLDEHYKDYLISAQCILDNDMKMKEFSTVLCPAAKVLEGILKKILIQLDIEREVNMVDDWNFGNVLHNSAQNRHIIYRYPETTHLPSHKEKAVFDLYDAVKYYRNDLNHGSPKPKIIVRDKGNAVKIYKEILNEIKKGYYNIIK